MFICYKNEEIENKGTKMWSEWHREKKTNKIELKPRLKKRKEKKRNKQNWTRMKEKKWKAMKGELLEFFVTLERQYDHDLEFSRGLHK